MTLEEALAECPAVAIIRGVTPKEVIPIVEALYNGGLRAVEVPLNSPDPLDSITKIAFDFGQRMAVGAGTVLTPEGVEQVAAAGGKIIVSPNTNTSVIRRAVELALTPIPGFATATDAFLAIEAGAQSLKLFPASTYGPAHVKQLKAVLPPAVSVWAVGGVSADDMQTWWTAGVRGFGFGSELYKPGQTPEDTFIKAQKVVAAAKALT